MTDQLSQAPSESLRDATFRGVRWVALARVAAEIFAFAAAVALARMVSPAEFGRAAVPLAIVPLAVILTFEGCASALVQRKSVTQTDRDSAVVMSLVAGLLLSTLTFALARPLGEPLFGERVAGLIALVSPVFLLASVGAVPRATMWRRLDFRRVSVVEVLSLAVGAALSIALALRGLDAEALIGGALAGLVHVAFSTAPYVILATRVSPTQTGLFWRAFQLGIGYQEKISGIMLRLAFPIYSRTDTPAELRRFHQRATRLHATAVVPLLALLIVVAPVLIPWLFGSPWRGAVVPTQILAVAGMIAAVLTGYPQVMLAVGRPRTLLHFNLAVLVVYVSVVLATAGRGLTAVCVGVVGVYVLILVGVYGLLLGPHVGVPMRRLLTDLAPAVVGSAALLAAGFPLRELLTSAGLPAPVTLAGVGLVGASAYLVTIRALFAAAWSDVVLLARNLAPARWRDRPSGTPESVPALSSTMS